MAQDNAQCTIHNAQRKYIDAEKFAKRIKASPAFENMAFEGELLQRVVLDLLGNAPAADVEEVKHGHFINIKGENEVLGTLTCSCCNYIYARLYPRNYCPNCGAKMDGGKAE